MLYRGDNMSVFLQRFIQNKKYILIAIGITGLIGFLFGFYQYTHTQEPIQKFFHYLFYLNIESYTNHYQLYIIQSGLLIFICTYLSVIEIELDTRSLFLARFETSCDKE